MDETFSDGYNFGFYVEYRRIWTHGEVGSTTSERRAENAGERSEWAPVQLKQSAE